MNVVTTYLYKSINNDVYMKILEGHKIPKAYNPNPPKVYSIKLQIYLYGFKQSGHMWYNYLTEYLLK